MDEILLPMSKAAALLATHGSVRKAVDFINKIE
jgi:hypothetical protein